jgi:hypothetical protein
MSTAGARHLAESEQWMQAQAVPSEPLVAPDEPVHTMTVPLYEVAAVHDGQPPILWLQALRRWARGRFAVGAAIKQGGVRL